MYYDEYEYDYELDEAIAMAADDNDCSEPGICESCNGSGEGQHDGATCYECKGMGES